MPSILIVALQTPEGLPPLSVTTLAALTSDHYSFAAHWEWADGPFEARLALGHDIVGFTYYGSTEWHVDDKVCEWARQLREQGITTIIGGPVASVKPEVFRDSALDRSRIAFDRVQTALSRWRDALIHDNLKNRDVPAEAFESPALNPCRVPEATTATPIPAAS